MQPALRYAQRDRTRAANALSDGAVSQFCRQGAAALNGTVSRVEQNERDVSPFAPRENQRVSIGFGKDRRESRRGAQRRFTPANGNELANALEQ